MKKSFSSLLIILVAAIHLKAQPFTLEAIKSYTFPSELPATDDSSLSKIFTTRGNTLKAEIQRRFSEKAAE